VSTAYLDTSFLLAIILEEPGAPRSRRLLAGYDRVISSDLLLAEALAAVTRERVGETVLAPVMESLALVLPTRSLASECRTALSHGYLRGADLWHVACALFFAGPRRGDLAFLSRDTTQRSIAKALGFPTP
jgi:predicted nucleic acid-binding protein